MSVSANHAVSRLFPTLHTTSETLYVLESHGYVLRCLTGSCPLIRSASVEDDLLVLCKGRQFLLELIE
jgi:hypothetical protein